MEPLMVLNSQCNVEKKNKAGGLTISDFRLYYKAAVVLTRCYGTKIDRATKGTGYKFRHTPTIMCSMNLPQSRQEYQKGKGQSLQQMALGKPDSYTQKNEIRLLLYTIHTHTKQFRDLNVRPETIHILQEGRQ